MLLPLVFMFWIALLIVSVGAFINSLEEALNARQVERLQHQSRPVHHLTHHPRLSAGPHGLAGGHRLHVHYR